MDHLQNTLWQRENSLSALPAGSMWTLMSCFPSMGSRPAPPSLRDEVLKIPQTGNSFVGERALKPHPDYYKIQSGDTLNTIACSYGDISPDMIAQQNNLTSDNYSPGDVILIP